MTLTALFNWSSREPAGAAASPFPLMGDPVFLERKARAALGLPSVCGAGGPSLPVSDAGMNDLQPH